VSARELRFIAFRVGAETFLVDIMAVRQILMYSGSTGVPTAPSFVEGVIVVRDEAIPVIDVHARLHPQRTAPAEQPLILLTHTAAGTIGLKVDEVRRLVTLKSDELLPAPAMVRGIRGEFLIAIAQQGDEIFLVLDLNRLLTSDEQQQLGGQGLRTQD
jgi:purine-binding chemotaxis protein CheW